MRDTPLTIQSNRPAGNVYGNKYYFRRKNHLSKLNIEISAFLNGSLIGCSSAYSGSVSDVKIFRRHIQWHKLIMHKNSYNDDEIEDTVGYR